MRLLSCALLLISSAFADGRNQVFSDFTTPLPLHPGEILVLGIVGGWERWDAPHRAIRRAALELRSMRLAGIWVETVENHKLELAQELVKQAFDFDKSGRLDPAESAAAQIIVYGHSLGGSATLRLCRWLNEQGIRVRLVIVVDAYGHDPYTVPPNVSVAANFYQRDFGPVRGARQIVAEDPWQTRILGNWRYSYKGRDVAMPGEPFIRRWFMGSHLKMEYDPEPWSRVRDLLVSAVKGSDPAAIWSLPPPRALAARRSNPIFGWARDTAFPSSATRLSSWRPALAGSSKPNRAFHEAGKASSAEICRIVVRVSATSGLAEGCCRIAEGCHPASLSVICVAIAYEIDNLRTAWCGSRQSQRIAHKRYLAIGGAQVDRTPTHRAWAATRVLHCPELTESKSIDPAG